MRSTRATGAVARLNRRAGSDQYAMVATGNGLFYLVQAPGGGAVTDSVPMALDAFVQFVDAFGPQIPRKASKLDLLFEQQLVRKKPPQKS